jgi:addiction module RelB/DinJ family antitoxin
MDTNMTFRMDSEVKAQMSAICAQLGMTTSTAFNVFANAFVRAKGMPFAVTIQEPTQVIPKEQMLADTDQMLSDFAADYKRMAE